MRGNLRTLPNAKEFVRGLQNRNGLPELVEYTPVPIPLPFVGYTHDDPMKPNRHFSSTVAQLEYTDKKCSPLEYLKFTECPGRSLRDSRWVTGRVHKLFKKFGFVRAPFASRSPTSPTNEPFRGGEVFFHIGDVFDKKGVSMRDRVLFRMRCDGSAVKAIALQVLRTGREVVNEGIITHYDCDKGFGFLQAHKPGAQTPYFFMNSDVLRNKKNIADLTYQPETVLHCGRLCEFQAGARSKQGEDRPRAMHVFCLEQTVAKSAVSTDASFSQARRSSRDVHSAPSQDVRNERRGSGDVRNTTRKDGRQEKKCRDAIRDFRNKKQGGEGRGGRDGSFGDGDGGGGGGGGGVREDERTTSGEDKRKEDKRRTSGEDKKKED
jgi:hypothetical protein